ncbi:MAG: RNA polymerase sigma factor [Armatimonadota bacterium]
MIPGCGEEYWVERIRQGDAAALELLFRRYVNRVFGLAYALLRSREEAEEVVTDTFLRAFRFAPDLQGGFETWLLRIARNLCLDRLRRPRVLTLPLDEVGDASALLTPADQMDRTSVRILVEQALDRLPEEYRVALILRDVQGLSAREAAEVVGKGETAFRSLHQRARRALRDALQSLERADEEDEA